MKDYCAVGWSLELLQIKIYAIVFLLYDYT